MRLRHYQAAAAGNANQAIQEAELLYAESLKQMETALNDLNGAVKYILDGENEHPNRNDIVQGKTGLQQAAAFGRPSAPYGTNPFGQPPALGATQSVFGQPSTLGQPSGLNQPVLPTQGSAFGQPSSLGGTMQPFGQPSSATGPFSAPSTVSPFSQIKPSPFGQTPAPSTGGFGQPTQPSGAFQAPPSSYPFGQPATASPFGAKTATQQQFSQPFGSPAPSEGIPAFGQPPTATNRVIEEDTKPPPVYKEFKSGELNPVPLLTGKTVREAGSRKLVSWKGQPVKYVDDWPCYLHPDDQKTWVRIHFPDGPPDPASLRDAQAKPEEYTPELIAQYEFFVKNGYFKDGVLPSLPPKPEWINFEF